MSSLRLYQTEIGFRLTDLVAAAVNAPANAALLRSLTACVDKYLDQCGRRWVDLSTIFGKMKVKTVA
jgi:DNA polymerase alpha subunit A